MFLLFETYSSTTWTSTRLRLESFVFRHHCERMSVRRIGTSVLAWWVVRREQYSIAHHVPDVGGTLSSDHERVERSILFYKTGLDVWRALNTEELPSDGSIVVCVDGSDDDRSAVEWAVRLAQHVHSSIRLVHALPDVGKWFDPAVLIAGDRLESELRRVGKKFLDDAVLIVRDLDAEIEVECSITGGAATDLIETVSANSRLLILGGSRTGPLRDLIFGHSIIELVNAAVCPVLVWRKGRDESADPTRPIVVGIDGSQPSRRALRAAFDLARTFGTDLVAVHVGAVEDADELDYGTSVDRQQQRDVERKWLHDIVDPYKSEYPTVAVEVRAVGASVARELGTMSATAQVIAVGSRGRGRLSSAILGSVSQSLIHRAQCPVLVVP